MIINSSNANIINTKAVDLHDYMFRSIEYDFIDSVVKIKYGLGKEIIFYSVLGISTVACRFWGETDPAILDFVYVPESDRIILPKLLKEREDGIQQYGKHAEGRMKTDTTYIEVLLVLSTGDRITIVCESIEI